MKGSAAMSESPIVAPRFGDVIKPDFAETYVMLIAHDPTKRFCDTVFGLRDEDTDNDWTGLVRNVNWTRGGTRRLMPVLHHIDGNPENNDPANLRVIEP